MITGDDTALIYLFLFHISQTLSERFYPHPEIETDAVFSLDEDVLLQPDEVRINSALYHNIWGIV